VTPNDEALSLLPGVLRSNVGAWAGRKQAVGPFLLARRLKADGVTGTTATLLYLAAASGSITELAIIAAMMSS
jgi:hypothetical protein